MDEPGSSLSNMARVDCISRCVGCEPDQVRALPGSHSSPPVFLATRSVEFDADHHVQAVVWLELAPTARLRGADEALGDAGLHTNTGYSRRELYPWHGNRLGISESP
jgi:hypothetical protein